MGQVRNPIPAEMLTFSEDLIAEVVLKNKCPCPGKDGIPFKAYNICEIVTIPLIKECLDDVFGARLHPIPESMKDLILIFIPKKPSGEIDGVGFYHPWVGILPPLGWDHAGLFGQFSASFRPVFRPVSGQFSASPAS